MDGFLVIDKPAGHTSHDIVARVRKAFRQKRVGHAGTLDPDATGVLIVLLGNATRLAEYTSGYLKRYSAIMCFGITTSTQDASGKVLQIVDASTVTREAFEACAAGFAGEIKQVPPMVSAVHHEGRRLHELARQGIVVDVPARPVTIHSISVLSFEPGEKAVAALEVSCSSGTYVRTLCHDIGAALGTGGFLQSLRRTAVGVFSVADGVSIEAMAEHPGQFVRASQYLLPAEWPRIEGSAETWTEISHGRAIPADGNGEFAAFLYDGRLCAVLRRTGDMYRPEKVFPEQSQ